MSQAHVDTLLPFSSTPYQEHVGSDLNLVKIGDDKQNTKKTTSE
jgi:hypothetical protein